MISSVSIGVCFLVTTTNAFLIHNSMRPTALKMVPTSIDGPSFASYLDAMYATVKKLKCPFFRRRASDIVDGFATTWNFLCSRHKSLPLYELPGCSAYENDVKCMNLPLEELSRIIVQDWNHGKGYYITGLLTKEIYRNDCLFDGPDPDMPVKGLRKYLSSASNLFDKKVSKAELISLQLDHEQRKVCASWRLEGVLNLPWHPSVKPWTGSTTYIFDEDMLVERHVETWDISVLDAFLSTLFPDLGYGAPPAPPISTPFDTLSRDQFAAGRE